MTDPVQQQLDAYNDRDLDRFIDAYSPEARFVDGEGGPDLDRRTGDEGLLQSRVREQPGASL